MSPQALAQSKREPEKRASSWSLDLSESLNVRRLRFLKIHHIKHNGTNLQSKGFDFVDWCIMCHCGGETMECVATLWEGSLLVELCLWCFWDFVGSFKISCRFLFWLLELVGEAFT